MMNWKHLMASILILASASALAFGGRQSSAPSQPVKQAAAQKHASPDQDEGQQVFEEHCSRCHTAPDGFSPRISGTVVRHMRVRASLSRKEEEELLRFFNP